MLIFHFEDTGDEGHLVLVDDVVGFGEGGGAGFELDALITDLVEETLLELLSLDGHVFADEVQLLLEELEAFISGGERLLGLLLDLV